MTEAVQHITDLQGCIKLISNRSEHDVFDLALKELNQSFLAALNSHYRQSFSGQRLALELWFSAIHFSTNEFNFRKWKMDERDITWNSLINPDDGILSLGFAHVYWPEAENRVSVYRNISEKIYRECSQFVHGNSETHVFLPETFGYSKNAVLVWKNNFDTLMLLFLYTFILRFNKDFSAQDYAQIASALSDTLGHVNEVRNLIRNGSM